MATNTFRILSAATLVAVGLAACSSQASDKGATPAAGTTPVSTAAPASSDVASSSAAGASDATPSAVAGSSETASGASPCDLLTEAEVATALDTKQVTEKFVEHGPPLGGKQCLWSTETLPIKTYSLTITTSAGLAKALRDAGQTGTTLYESAKKLYSGAQPLPGIGDEALLAKSTIIARKGDTFISAQTLFGVSDSAIGALKALTTTAVAKI